MNLDEFCKRFAHFGDEAFLATFTRPFLLEEGRLILEGGDSHSRSVYQLRADGPSRVGRGSSADVRIRNEQVSSRHAVLLPPAADGDPWVVVDAGSTNGTFVNGSKIEPEAKVPLQDGTLLGFGLEVRLTFLEPRGILRVVRRLTEDGGGAPSGEDPLASTHHDGELSAPAGRTAEHDMAGLASSSGAVDGAGDLRLRCDPFDPVRLEEGRPITVGRSPNGADMVLPHHHVSRQHCVFERKGDRVFLRDCGSANGTFVCQVRIGQSATEVLPGKPVTIGPFTVHVDGGATAESEAGHTQIIDARGRAAARHEVGVAALVDTLQEIETEQRSGVLEVEGDGIEGRIAFRAGEPWNARTSDGAADVDAIRRMLQLSHGKVGIVFDEVDPGERRITMSFGEILLDDFLLSES